MLLSTFNTFSSITLLLALPLNIYALRIFDDKNTLKQIRTNISNFTDNCADTGHWKSKDLLHGPETSKALDHLARSYVECTGFLENINHLLASGKLTSKTKTKENSQNIQRKNLFGLNVVSCTGVFEAPNELDAMEDKVEVFGKRILSRYKEICKPNVSSTQPSECQGYVGILELILFNSYMQIPTNVRIELLEEMNTLKNK